MPRKSDIIKINLAAGAVRANDMLCLLNILQQYKIPEVRSGGRQQLFVRSLIADTKNVCKAIEAAGFFLEINSDQHPNIVSSFVGHDVFYSSPQLAEGIYKDILEGFNYSPKLKINIVDQQQSFTPFFTGHLNFISSHISNYWHARIRFPGTNIYYSWPGLIYSTDIPRLSRRIEELIYQMPGKYQGQTFIDGESFYRNAISGETFHMQDASQPIQVPVFKLPYYEGFNQFLNRTWLGIYRRDECFPVNFLLDACQLCIHTNSSEIFFTPWKSMVIKNIDSSARKLWDAVLDKHRINVRHASNELNWQVEDDCDDALALKKKLVTEFDKQDMRTYGLCFAIKTKPRSGLFGSVIIRKQTKSTGERYTLMYTADFNPNTRDLVVFRQDIRREMIATYLVSLCRFYYEQQMDPVISMSKVFREGEEKQQVALPALRIVHQCMACFTVYDELYGEPDNGIDEGTRFTDLPVSYCCSTCGGTITNFSEIQVDSLEGNPRF